MGAVVYSVMVALGEMATLFPVSGSFVSSFCYLGQVIAIFFTSSQTHYATRWLDPALGFSLGYTYWCSYAISLPTEITAAAIVISYWDSTTKPAVWISIFLFIIVLINLYV